jgi:hypothetical protein
MEQCEHGSGAMVLGSVEVRVAINSFFRFW